MEQKWKQFIVLIELFFISPGLNLKRSPNIHKFINTKNNYKSSFSSFEKSF